MKRNIVLIMIVTLLLAMSSVAHAGIFGTVKGWIASEVFALALTVIVLGLSTAFGVMFGKVSKTLTEAGEFMTVLGTALADSRLSKDELKSIVKEGKDVFSLWRKTPVKYKVE